MKINSRKLHNKDHVHITHRQSKMLSKELHKQYKYFKTPKQR